MATTLDDVLHDLTAEFERLESILSGLSDAQWQVRSGAPDWTVFEVVVHLAITEEGVTQTLAGPTGTWTHRDRPLDAAVDDNVRAVHATPDEILARWRAARHASVAALRAADPHRPVRWAAAPLKPQTLATTRLAEHWAHGLDITEPLGIAFPDTDRLRHIAWLGHATLPYAMRLAGLEVHDVHCVLTAPGGSLWEFGPSDAASQITGPAGALCRVGARRLKGDESGLSATGPHAHDALRVLRNYAA